MYQTSYITYRPQLKLDLNDGDPIKDP